MLMAAVEPAKLRWRSHQCAAPAAPHHSSSASVERGAAAASVRNTCCRTGSGQVSRGEAGSTPAACRGEEGVGGGISKSAQEHEFCRAQVCCKYCAVAMGAGCDGTAAERRDSP